MKYFMLIFPICISIYILSFAKYNWDNRNKIAAIGAMLIAVTATVISLFTLP